MRKIGQIKVWEQSSQLLFETIVLETLVSEVIVGLDYLLHLYSQILLYFKKYKDGALIKILFSKCNCKKVKLFMN
jgi:hypothetical protein